MEISSDSIVESRQELMVSPTDHLNAKPILRTAHFLKPSSTDHSSSLSLPSLPPKFDPKNLPFTVNFHGWRNPLQNWKQWVEKMASFHASTWKKAGIYDAIFNSTFEIHKNGDFILGLAERWCPDTNSFVFPWGEATVTLEDMLHVGYSVLGNPVFKPLETEESKEVEEALVLLRWEVNKARENKACQATWLKTFMDSGCETEHEAFLSLWLTRFVFPNTLDAIGECVFPIAIHLARGTRIALAPAVLSTIYRDLSLLKQKIVSLTTLDAVNDEKVVVTTYAPFQLVLVWVWERFVKLRPKPNLLKIGEPRFVQWNSVKGNVKNVRQVLDSSKESFIWRPYTKPLENWDIPKFYREKELWVHSDSDLDDDLLSFIVCLRVSELVGMESECIQQYLPHRVARQFGFDQDVPGFVVQSSGSFKDAWSSYIRPIDDVECFIPSRLFEKDVTIRYLDWLKSLHSNLVIDVLKDKKKAEASLSCGDQRADGDYSNVLKSSNEDNPTIAQIMKLNRKQDFTSNRQCGDNLSKTSVVAAPVEINDDSNRIPSQLGSQSCSAAVNGVQRADGDYSNVLKSSDEDNPTIAQIMKLNQKQDVMSNRQCGNCDNLSKTSVVAAPVEINDDFNRIPSQSWSHSCSGAVNGVLRGSGKLAENVRVELGECQSLSFSVGGNDQTPNDSTVKEATIAQNVNVNAKQDVESAKICVTRSSADNEKNKINGYSDEAALTGLECRIERLEKIVAARKALLSGRNSGSKHVNEKEIGVNRPKVLKVYTRKKRKVGN